MPVLEHSARMSIEPQDVRLKSSKWFYLWSISPLGECVCPRGNFHNTDEHGNAYGGPLNCESSGKHPHSSFPHGASDALSYEELISQHGQPGGSRRLAMCLQDVVLLDIDSQEALQSFYRIRMHVPTDDRLLGIARTPRGWHVYLSVPSGWTQKAMNLAMRDWLGTGFWDPVDHRKIARRGLILDARTGERRYTVWPGQGSRDRHWATRVEFTSALNFASRGMPKARVVQDGSLAPWNLEMTEQLRERIERAGADTVTRTQLALDGSAADLDTAWRELERWASVLEKMDPETGRNNALNRTAYHSGADAVAAGHTADKVRARLLQAAAQNKTPGAAATIASGLTSGLRDRYARS